jgi:FimV-like protein
MLNVAQSHVALGENAKAIELFKQVIENGAGSDRRAAKKALRKLE